MARPKSVNPVTSRPPALNVSRPVGSDPTIPYIASDSQYPWFAVDRALPQTIDEAERRFGIGLYERMNEEPILATAEAALRTLVLADGISVSPSHDAPKSSASSQDVADYAQSMRMREYIHAVIDRLAVNSAGLRELSMVLLDGWRLGHKLAEITYDVIDRGPWRGCVGVASISPKPRENYAFVLDSMNRFRGVIAKIPGSNILVWQGIIYDLSVLDNAIAPEKLLIYTPYAKDGDPRGVSAYRAAYQPYRDKQRARRYEASTLEQFGGGRVSVVAPEIKASAEFVDPDTGLKSSLLQEIYKQAKKWTANGALVVPFGSQVEVHAPSANPAIFQAALDRYDREMAGRILLNARTLLEARHGSKADTENAEDIVDELKIHIRQDLCDLFTRRLFRPLVAMSFGEEVADKFTPQASMQKASRPDFAVNATAVAALQTSGYLDASQLPQVDEEILGLEPRTGLDDDPANVDDEQPGGAGPKPGTFHGRPQKLVSREAWSPPGRI